MPEDAELKVCTAEDADEFDMKNQTRRGADMKKASKAVGATRS